MLLLLPIVILSIFKPGWRRHVLFPYIAGSISSWIILGFIDAMKMDVIGGNAYLIALAVIVIIFFWKFLFGPWDSKAKAAVLGIFIGWIGVDMLEGQSMQEQIATILVVIIAAIPAGIWCVLFWRQHKNRLSIVLLTFFAGMLSTAPILFYDAIVRGGYELNFFLFRITPESLGKASRTFAQMLTGESGIVSASVTITLVSFALVGIIEEWSKNWVVRKSDPSYFSSVNDVIQLSIIAAIGFAFAENIVNPNYFMGFIKSYLAGGDPRWGAFLASVFGRSIITNMVHITCSGVLGYFYGLAFFAKPALEDDRAHGKRHRLVLLLHKMTGLSRITIYRNVSMTIGLVTAMAMHSLFDIMVSLPETLSTHPQTLGDLFNFSGAFGDIPIVLIPSAIYVFGGFFLLMYLFGRKGDIKQHGFRFRQEVFVNPAAAARTT